MLSVYLLYRFLGASEVKRCRCVFLFVRCTSVSHQPRQHLPVCRVSPVVHSVVFKPFVFVGLSVFVAASPVPVPPCVPCVPNLFSRFSFLSSVFCVYL